MWLNQGKTMQSAIHLSPRQKQVLKIIKEYLDERGQRCFSYDGIMPYFLRYHHDAMPAATFDRRIRELAEMGVIERREVKTSESKPSAKKRSVIFCWTETAEALYNMLIEEERRAKSKLQNIIDENSMILRPMATPQHELEFYATGAPEWWPFQLMTLSSKTVPSRDHIVLLDNNAFSYWRRNEWPSITRWAYELRVTALRLASRAAEVRIILPDKPRDPKTSFEWYSATYKMLCSESMKKHGVKCVATIHFDPANPATSIKTMIEHILDAFPDVDIIASPTKPYCGRYKTDKIVVDDVCFISIVGRVAGYVGNRRPVHVLAPPLRTSVLKRIAPLAHSFDTTSWTRPISSELRKLGIKHSAKTSKERELMFAYTVAYLHYSGIPMRHVELAEEHLPDDILAAIKRRACGG